VTKSLPRVAIDTIQNSPNVIHGVISNMLSALATLPKKSRKRSAVDVESVIPSWMSLSIGSPALPASSTSCIAFLAVCSTRLPSIIFTKTLAALIKHLCKNILYKNGMINVEATKKIEEFYGNLLWPPSISRLPPSVSISLQLDFSSPHLNLVQVGRGAGSIKADQWRSQITVFFVALFNAWQVNGEIPDIDAEPSASNTKNAAAQTGQEKLVRARMRENLLAKNPDATEDELDEIKTATMDRSLRRHYEQVVQFTAAIRIITSNSISPNEVKRGCGALERTIQEWARMNCHLVPYFHYAVHLQPQYFKHGPGPGWWTYPYERNNGFLGRFNHNGHSGGEMEGTMMRGWWKTTLIQDLVSSST
jgi:hypothetical protein